MHYESDALITLIECAGYLDGGQGGGNSGSGWY